MKKLLLGVIAFALIITSCNKYEDDFKDLNAKIDALKTQVAGVETLAAGITDLQAQLAALTITVGALPKTASIDKLTTDLGTLTTTVGLIQGKLNTVADDVATGKLKLDDAALVVDQLKIDLDTANANISTLMASADIFEGDLIINDEATLAFAESLLNKVNLIKGSVVINTVTPGMTTAQKARLDVVAAKMFIAIGSNTIVLTSPNNIWSYTGGSTEGFPNLLSINANVTITASALVNFGTLNNVTGNYTVSGNDVNDAALATVSGDVELNYAGPYTSTALTTVGGKMTLTNKTTTTQVYFPLVTVGLQIYDGANLAGVLVFPMAEGTIDLKSLGLISSVHADKATTIKLRNTAYEGLTILADKATTVDLSTATKSTVAGISIITTVPTDVDLSNLETSVGSGSDPSDYSTFGIFIETNTTSGLFQVSTVNLSKFANVYVSSVPTRVDVAIKGPVSVNLPLWEKGKLTANKATTILLGNHDGDPTTLIQQNVPLVQNLTLGALTKENFDLSSFVQLKVAHITGKSTLTSGAPCATIVSNVDRTNTSTLTDLTLIGPLVSAVIQNQEVLTSFTTSGVINSLTVNSCEDLAGVIFNHTQTSTVGSTLIVTDNASLESLTTSTNYLKVLTVTGNEELTSLTMSSYQTIPSGAVAITIGPNNLTGVYTAAVGVIPTKIESPDLLTLRPYILKLETGGNTLALSADLYDCNGAAEGHPKLSDAVSALISVGGMGKAITTIAEYKFVQ